MNGPGPAHLDRAVPGQRQTNDSGFLARYIGPNAGVAFSVSNSGPSLMVPSGVGVGHHGPNQDLSIPTTVLADSYSDYLGCATRNGMI